jgi:hypothetical protein
MLRTARRAPRRPQVSRALSSPGSIAEVSIQNLTAPCWVRKLGFGLQIGAI